MIGPPRSQTRSRLARQNTASSSSAAAWPVPPWPSICGCGVTRWTSRVMDAPQVGAGIAAIDPAFSADTGLRSDAARDRVAATGAAGICRGPLRHHRPGQPARATRRTGAGLWRACGACIAYALGLKLAALVARAHRGHLRIAAVHPDGSGLAVRLSFWVTGPPPDGANPPAPDIHRAPSAQTQGLPSIGLPANPMPQRSNPASS